MYKIGGQDQNLENLQFSGPLAILMKFGKFNFSTLGMHIAALI